MENHLYVENPELNGPISFDEFEKIINKLKINKSSGIDQIPNEVLKIHYVMLLLYNLFTKCFEFGVAGRAMGSIISKFKSLKNVGFETYSKLYHSGVVPIMDYCSGI